MTSAKNLPPGTPKIWSWGGPPADARHGPPGSLGPTEEILFELCRDLPQCGTTKPLSLRLYVILYNLIHWHVSQLPWTQKRKDWLRFLYVTEEREKGKTMQEACAAVAKRLADGEIVNGIKGEPSPAAAGKEMVKKSYQSVMRSLPVEQRPRRTRKRKTKKS